MTSILFSMMRSSLKLSLGLWKLKVEWFFHGCYCNFCLLLFIGFFLCFRKVHFFNVMFQSSLLNVFVLSFTISVIFCFNFKSFHSGLLIFCLHFQSFLDFCSLAPQFIFPLSIPWSLVCWSFVSTPSPSKIFMFFWF